MGWAVSKLFGSESVDEILNGSRLSYIWEMWLPVE